MAEYPISNMITFLGGRIVGVNGSFGINTSPSTLNLQLADDPNHPTEPTSVSESDLVVGSYYDLTINNPQGGAFHYGGILGKYTKPQKGTSAQLWKLSFSDAREILKSIQIIIGPAARRIFKGPLVLGDPFSPLDGPPIDINGDSVDIQGRIVDILYQFGQLGAAQFQGIQLPPGIISLNLAKRTEDGIPYGNIIKVLQGGNQPVEIFGQTGSVNFPIRTFQVFGVEYQLDFDQMKPFIKQNLRLNGTFVNLLDFIQKTARAHALDWYVETEDSGNTKIISIKVIDRSSDQIDTGLVDFIGQLNADIDSTGGVELVSSAQQGKQLKNEISTAILESDNLEKLIERQLRDTDDHVDLVAQGYGIHYPDEDQMRAALSGQDSWQTYTAITAATGSKNPITQFKKTVRQAKLSAIDRLQSQKALIFADLKRAREGDISILPVGQGNAQVRQSQLDGAIAAYKDQINEIKQAIHDAKNDINGLTSLDIGVRGKGIQAIANDPYFRPLGWKPIMQSIGQSSAEGKQRSQRQQARQLSESYKHAEDVLDEQIAIKQFNRTIKNVFDKIQSFAQQHYGQTFQYDKVGDGYSQNSTAYTHGVANGGASNDINRFFQDGEKIQQGKFGSTSAYAVFEGVDQQAVRKGVVILQSYGPEDFFFESGDLYVKADIGNGRCKVKAITLRPDSNLSPMWLSVKDNLELAKQGGLSLAFPGIFGFSTANRALKPSRCWVPVKSKFEFWYVWFSKIRGEGTVAISQDTSLHPANFGSWPIMQQIGQLKVDRMGAQGTEANTGSLTHTGLPRLSIGQRVGDFSNVSQVSITFGAKTVQTSYTFQSYFKQFGDTPKLVLDKLSDHEFEIRDQARKFNQELLRLLSQNDQIQRLRDQKKQLQKLYKTFGKHSNSPTQLDNILGLPISFDDYFGVPAFGRHSAIIGFSLDKIDFSDQFTADKHHRMYQASSIGVINRDDWQDVYGASLDALFSGFDGADFSGQGTPNASDVNPYKLIDADSDGNKYPNIEQVIHGTSRGAVYSLGSVRGLGLKTPLVMTGWGYDLSGNPTFTEQSQKLDPSSYKSGPLDMRWNQQAGMWQAFFPPGSGSLIADHETPHTSSTYVFDGPSLERQGPLSSVFKVLAQPSGQTVTDPSGVIAHNFNQDEKGDYIWGDEDKVGRLYKSIFVMPDIRDTTDTLGDKTLVDNIDIHYLKAQFYHTDLDKAGPLPFADKILNSSALISPVDGDWLYGPRPQDIIAHVNKLRHIDIDDKDQFLIEDGDPSIETTTYPWYQGVLYFQPFKDQERPVTTAGDDPEPGAPFGNWKTAVKVPTIVDYRWKQPIKDGDIPTSTISTRIYKDISFDNFGLLHDILRVKEVTQRHQHITDYNDTIIPKEDPDVRQDGGGNNYVMLNVDPDQSFYYGIPHNIGVSDEKVDAIGTLGGILNGVLVSPSECTKHKHGTTKEEKLNQCDGHLSYNVKIFKNAEQDGPLHFDDIPGKDIGQEYQGWFYFDPNIQQPGTYWYDPPMGKWVPVIRVPIDFTPWEPGTPPATGIPPFPTPQQDLTPLRFLKRAGQQPDPDPGQSRDPADGQSGPREQICQDSSRDLQRGLDQPNENDKQLPCEWLLRPDNPARPNGESWPFDGQGFGPDTGLGVIKQLNLNAAHLIFDGLSRNHGMRMYRQMQQNPYNWMNYLGSDRITFTESQKLIVGSRIGQQMHFITDSLVFKNNTAGAHPVGEMRSDKSGNVRLTTLGNLVMNQGIYFPHVDAGIYPITDGDERGVGIDNALYILDRFKNDDQVTPNPELAFRFDSLRILQRQQHQAQPYGLSLEVDPVANVAHLYGPSKLYFGNASGTINSTLYDRVLSAIDVDFSNVPTVGGVDLALITDVPSVSDFVRTDGTTPLTANWDAGSFDITAEQFHSDITTGTSPFTVVSTTVVANLNADTVDSIEGAEILQRDGSVPLTNAWNAGAFSISTSGIEILNPSDGISVGGTIGSTVANGPFIQLRNWAGTEYIILNRDSLGQAVFGGDVRASGDMYVGGKLTVDGVIDPIGLEFDTFPSNPGATQRTIWANSGHDDNLYYGDQRTFTIPSGLQHVDYPVTNVVNTTSIGLDYVVLDTDINIHLYNDGGGTIQCNLPVISTVPQRRIFIKRVGDGGTYNVNAQAGDSIQTTGTSIYTLSAQYDAVAIYNPGSGTLWYIQDEYTSGGSSFDIDALAALGAAPASADYFAVSDAGTQKKATMQEVLGGLHNITALGAAPATNDLVLITDQSAAGDPARSVTVSQLLQGFDIDGYSALTVAPAASDYFIFSDAGTEKKITHQTMLRATYLTSLGNNIDDSDTVLVHDASAAGLPTRKVTISQLFNVIDHFTQQTYMRDGDQIPIRNQSGSVRYVKFQDFNPTGLQLIDTVIVYTGTGSSGKTVTLSGVNRAHAIYWHSKVGDTAVQLCPFTLPDGNTGTQQCRYGSGGQTQVISLNAPAAGSNQTLTLNTTGSDFNQSGKTYRIHVVGTSI